ncbi:uncharacterized protein DSM5745_05167 [Aspergillus mulundensis]|uniref:Uncharacterized protein n=1 Tax=Aspergillus mulundensis TaxID=1810919 RepID=A0A3D8S5Y1_9EURO|nr:hypothetical protein DSM5745_05167 [Aspergillus mulundensis]RDW81610.1 hypothetical protein DSM5745_05167 [Aspergillus mulundensis]
MPTFPVTELQKPLMIEIGRYLGRDDLVKACKAEESKDKKLTLDGVLSLGDLSRVFNWACETSNAVVLSHLMHYYQFASWENDPELAPDMHALVQAINLVDDDGNSFLHQMCMQAGKENVPTAIANIKVLLRLGLGINNLKANSKGDTPFTTAIRAKSLEIVRFLISQNVNVNLSIGEKKPQTPLKVALLLAPDNKDNKNNEDNHEVVACLLAAGATVECKTHGSGLALLQQCVATGQPRCFALILNAWKRQNVMLEYKNPAVTLCAAVTLGDMLLVHKQLKQGKVDANCTVYGTSPLIAAITVGNPEATELFMKHTSPAGFDRTDAAGRTPLHLAIIQGPEKEKLVRQLLPLTNRLRPGDKNRKRTPLVEAVEHQSPDIVAMILDRVLTNNSGPNHEESEVYLGLRQWNTPKQILTAEDNAVAALEMAIMKQNYAAVRVLIDHPLNPAKELGEHKLLLHMAFFYGDSNKMDDIAVALIEWGAEVKHVRQNLNTNLIAAGEAGCAKALAALIKKGAELNAKSMKERTALTGAVGNNHPDAVRVLLEAGADPHVQMHSTPWYRMQLREGRVSNTETLFEHAVGRGYAEVVKLLMPHFDMGTQCTTGGENALTTAVQYGHPETVRALLDTGRFDLGHENALGLTAKDLAKKCSPSFPEDLVKKLSP